MSAPLRLSSKLSLSGSCKVYFAGAIGVARGCVTVVTDPSNEGRAYAISRFLLGLWRCRWSIMGAACESHLLRTTDSLWISSRWNYHAVECLPKSGLASSTLCLSSSHILLAPMPQSRIVTFIVCLHMCIITAFLFLFPHSGHFSLCSSVQMVALVRAHRLLPEKLDTNTHAPIPEEDSVPPSPLSRPSRACNGSIRQQSFRRLLAIYKERT